MSVEQGEIYECGDKVQVEVLQGKASCELACCGEPMKSLKEKTADAANEKHVPVIEKVDGGYRVKVGSVAHPMEADHWIQWIELRLGSKVYREFLEPGQAPEATFYLEDSGTPVAREHCNKHGLWRG